MLRGVARTLEFAIITTWLTGCPVTVTMSDIGSFGPGASAVWLEIETEVEQEGGPEYYNGFLISNRTGLCDAIQGVYPDLVPIADEIGTAQAENRPDDECDAVQTYYATLGDALGSFHGHGANLLEMPFFEMTNGETTVPPDGTWEYDSSNPTTDPEFHLRVYLFQEDYFEAAREEVESDGAGCLWNAGAAESAYEKHHMGHGSVAVEHRSETQIHLDADVVMFPADGGNPPQLTVRGTFTHCPIQASTDRFVPFLPPWN